MWLTNDGLSSNRVINWTYKQPFSLPPKLSISEMSNDRSMGTDIIERHRVRYSSLTALGVQELYRSLLPFSNTGVQNLSLKELRRSTYLMTKLRTPVELLLIPVLYSRNVTGVGRIQIQINYSQERNYGEERGLGVLALLILKLAYSNIIFVYILKPRLALFIEIVCVACARWNILPNSSNRINMSKMVSFPFQCM